MKLLLSSQGFTTEDLILEFEKLCGKDRSQISVAIINEAHVPETGDKRWTIIQQKIISDTFGGKVELINLLAMEQDDVVRRVSSCDAIYVIGGNTDYLMYVYEKTGFTNSLKMLLNEKVYVGSSAGSMVLAKRVSTNAYKTMYGEADDFGTTKYMELVDFAIAPHFDNPEFNNRDEPGLLIALKDFHGTLFGINDEQAVVVNNENISFVGGNPFTFKN